MVALLLAIAARAAEPPDDSAAYVHLHVDRLKGSAYVVQVSHLTLTNNGGILAYTAKGENNTGTIFCIVPESGRNRFLDRYPRIEQRRGKRISTKPLRALVRKAENGALLEVDLRFFPE